MVSLNLSSITNEINKYLTLAYIPQQYQWLVPVGFVILGLLLLFKSRDTWQYAIGAIGFIGGYFEVMNLLTKYQFTLIVHGYAIPTYVWAVAAGVLAFLLLYAIVEFAIMAALAYASYYVLAVYLHYSLSLSIVAAVLVFGFTFLIYKRIVSILAKVMGTAILFLGLVMFNVKPLDAIIIAAILLFIAGIWMLDRKKIIKMWNAWLVKHKFKKQQKNQAKAMAKLQGKNNLPPGGSVVINNSVNAPDNASQTSVNQNAQVQGGTTVTNNNQNTAEGGDTGMGIIGKVVKAPLKLIPGRHKDEVSSTPETTPAPAPTPPVAPKGKQVNADGTIEDVK